MKVLIVNKFLYPNGGSETYIFELGKELERTGHEVQFFGMEHEGRIVGNHVESYTSNMDFHSSKIQKLLYPLRIIYSFEARKKISQILKDFQPDVIHLNNINFQITPSIIDEIVRYRKNTKKNVKIIATVHDYQWICPNHMLYIPERNAVCEKCIGSHYSNCIKNRCIHGSFLKSLLGSLEGYLYHFKKTYSKVDCIICPSEFIARQFSKNNIFANKLIVKHNFLISQETFGKGIQNIEKRGYVLYFGRYSKEKGIETLLNVCKKLPEIPFVFAGSGPLEDEVNAISNVKNMGFQKGSALHKLITEANFSIYPSEWYENCPFSVMESQMDGTPVIAADIGGIPELIQNQKTGLLFQSGNEEQLKNCIQDLWNDKERQKNMSLNCEELPFEFVEEYTKELLEKVYR